MYVESRGMVEIKQVVEIMARGLIGLLEHLLKGTRACNFLLLIPAPEAAVPGSGPVLIPAIPPVGPKPSE